MHSVATRLLAPLLILLILAATARGTEPFPLEPVDTASPRATLESFLAHSTAFVQAMRAPSADRRTIRDELEKAMRCLDLSSVPPNMANDIGLESVLLLREILDRIPLPAPSDIPDNSAVKQQQLARWRVPHTELLIAKVTSGPRADDFLFAPETIARLDAFYTKIRHRPYQPGAMGGIYEQYIFTPGWLIPRGMINALPQWMKREMVEQAVWQWIGLVLALTLGGMLLWKLLRWHRAIKDRETARVWRLHLLLAPLSAMGLCLFLRFFIDHQINITGAVLKATVMGLEFALLILQAWAILVAGSVTMNGIITSQHIKEDALDADVIRLLCRLLSFSLVFVVFYHGGTYFGLPVAAIFTSAGIAGVAVALAARETLANFFGGVSIFLDRPFRTGDFIVLENGERGEVKAVGMRSTRILTLDDILITIPNSVITNVKIVNQSMPKPHYRLRIQVGVAYGSDLDRIEQVLLDVAGDNQLVMQHPAPRVRLLNFGASAINIELQAWAIHPQVQGRLTHELNTAIYKRFLVEGIEIPFPQLDIHLQPTAVSPETQTNHDISTTTNTH
ncbi:MscS Mechanosensitive ion channel [Desulfobulbus propionicus DSM 2032]|uniref:MscS Mechanosensitive ion channel n=1 Tax=Desulfobulbus propionicus (strain ATCC 33891 / DSM 2032 / VKM B-1956 / 1pr3) TaxID=577650 RepID=A0A7U4DN17_DESPD|nr:mechanosensitive ion channel family protein [Desulfobulbus propionicus]ADW16636.1 MscS Mechanosensitive ion channel [Desulfobulbus propionicus DSM 2032]